MSSCWAALILGLVLGGIGGIILVCILQAAGDADRRTEDMMRRLRADMES